jgi:HlyD family secretion protein
LGLVVILVAGIAVRLSGVSFGALRSGEAETTYIAAPIERGDVSTTLTATGSLKALVTVQVGSQLSGQIA